MSVQRTDVIATLKRTFGTARTPQVLDVLDRCGSDLAESERARVHLAIIQLSGGDEHKLEQFVATARVDHRDVLYWVESTPASDRDAELLSVLGRAWCGLLPDPRRIVAVSAFGNVVVECGDGRLWRVCPEDLAATVIDSGAPDLAALLADSGFREDWLCEAWVEAAQAALGPLEAGRCYGFKVWPVLGGAYDGENVVIKTLTEWLAASGDLARQVQDRPDGSTIQLDPRQE